MKIIERYFDRKSPFILYYENGKVIKCIELWNMITIKMIQYIML